MIENLPDVGTHVKINGGKRKGYVVGYTTFKDNRISAPYTYLIIKLDRESCAYLEARRGQAPQDCFITTMIVHPSNVTL